jgi:hypothetical protein
MKRTWADQASAMAADTDGFGAELVKRIPLKVMYPAVRRVFHGRAPNADRDAYVCVFYFRQLYVLNEDGTFSEKPGAAEKVQPLRRDSALPCEVKRMPHYDQRLHTTADDVLRALALKVAVDPASGTSVPVVVHDTTGLEHPPQPSAQNMEIFELEDFEDAEKLFDQTALEP